MFEFEKIEESKEKKPNKCIILAIIVALALVTTVFYYTKEKQSNKVVSTPNEYRIRVKEGEHLDILQFITYYNNTKTEDMPEINMIVDDSPIPKLETYNGEDMKEKYDYEGFKTIYEIILGDERK